MLISRLFAPRNLDQVPLGAMEELYKHLLLFDVGVIAEDLQTELRSLREVWPKLKQSVPDIYCMQEESENINSEFEQDKKTLSSTCKSYIACPL